jgi:hypothetical protein
MRKGSKKQFCKHGHDTFICGRDKCGVCKECKRNYNRNKIKVIKHKKRFCLRGHDTLICGRTASNCNDCTALRNQEHKEERRQWQRAYDERRSEKKKKTDKERRKKNKIQIREYNKKHYHEKIVSDPIFKLKFYLRTRIRSAIKNNQKAGSAIRDLGCTIASLKQYIENKFYSGMTWDNWGEIWELDHVKALWKFDLTDKEQFLKACHYTNLQPLTISDHVAKTSKEAMERANRKCNNEPRS